MINASFISTLRQQILDSDPKLSKALSGGANQLGILDTFPRSPIKDMTSSLQLNLPNSLKRDNNNQFTNNISSITKNTKISSVGHGKNDSSSGTGINKHFYLDFTLLGALEATEKIVEVSNSRAVPLEKIAIDQLKRQTLNRSLSNSKNIARGISPPHHKQEGVKIYTRDNSISRQHDFNDVGDVSSVDNSINNHSHSCGASLSDQELPEDYTEREAPLSPDESIPPHRRGNKLNLTVDTAEGSRNIGKSSKSVNDGVSVSANSISKSSIANISGEEWISMINALKSSEYYYTAILPTITSSVYFQPDITPESIDSAISKFEAELKNQINNGVVRSSSSSKSNETGCSVKSLNMPLTFFTENILKTCISNAHLQLIELHRMDNARLASQAAAYELITTTADHLNEHKEANLGKSKVLLDKQLHFRKALEETRQKKREDQLQKDEERRKKNEEYLNQKEIERAEKEANKTHKLGNRKAKKEIIEREKTLNIELSLQTKDQLTRERLASRQNQRSYEIAIKAEERNNIIQSHQVHSSGIDQKLRDRAYDEIANKEQRYINSKAMYDYNVQNTKLLDKEKNMMKALEAETKRNIFRIRDIADKKQLEIKHDKLKTLHFQQVLTESEKRLELRNMQAEYFKLRGTNALEEMPGPGWYDVDGAGVSIGGGKISKSSGLGAFDNLRVTPGPGDYDPDVKSNAGSGAIPFMGKGKTDVDWLIHFAKLVPGPGYYNIDPLPPSSTKSSSRQGSRMSTAHDATLGVNFPDSASTGSMMSSISSSSNTMMNSVNFNLPFSPTIKSKCASPKFNSRGKTSVDDLILAAQHLPGPGDYEIPIDARYRSNKSLPVLHSLSHAEIKRVMTPSHSTRSNSKTNSRSSETATGFLEE